MKLKALMIIFCTLLISGCQTTRQEMVTATPIVTAIPVDACPMPSGYQLAPAIEVAEHTLVSCPYKLDLIFLKLLEIAKHDPDKENKNLIKKMLKKLVSMNKISESYSKGLYKKYFSEKFVSVPDIKTYNLSEEIDSIKRDLKEELALKREGIVECCNEKDRYKKSEAEYARLVSFMDKLLLNEEYHHENR